MVEAIFSLLGAGGAGAISGLVKYAIQNRNEQKREEARLANERDIASRHSLRDTRAFYADKPTEADLSSSSKVKIVLFGKEFSYESDNRKETVVHSLGSVGYNVALWLLVATLCGTILLWADNPGIIVWAANPDAQPSDVGILWGVLDFSFSGTQIREYTTGGLAFQLAHGVMFIVSLMLTGNSPRKK